MFWGCYSRQAGKGPGIFWEKDWGTITTESYCQHVVPIVHGWLTMHPGHLFMQDNAPSHASADTVKELEERGIKLIKWPPYSPDLNPIESVWDWMKDYIQNHFPEKMSYDALRKAVKEAWDAVPNDYLMELLDSMPDRCKAVIKANGMHTKY
jgi:DDE superfamily endonuclease